MENDGLDFDIETILECPDNEEFDVLQRLSASCQEFRGRVHASVESNLAHEKDYNQKCEAVKEQIAHLHSVNKEIVTALDNTILMQKVTDKKIAITEKQQVKIMEEIDNAKLRKESLALELVDLMQELEDGRNARKERWNAIKMACFIYKDKLDIHIELKQCEDHERLKFTFFTHKNPNRDSYYVHLLNYKNYWKVGEVEPELKDIHLAEIKTVIDFTKPLNTRDVTAFLCKLKSVFTKHYFEK